MKQNTHHMQITFIDEHLSELHHIKRPRQGWIRTIRTSLGMTLSQLGRKMGVSQQAAAKLERSEQEDSITLKSLQKTAAALNCRLVYGFVPYEGSLENTLHKQAYTKAKALIDPVDHSMMLEAQRTHDKQDRIKALAHELASTPTSELWE